MTMRVPLGVCRYIDVLCIYIISYTLIYTYSYVKCLYAYRGDNLFKQNFLWFPKHYSEKYSQV